MPNNSLPRVMRSDKRIRPGHPEQPPRTHAFNSETRIDPSRRRLMPCARLLSAIDAMMMGLQLHSALSWTNGLTNTQDTMYTQDARTLRNTVRATPHRRIGRDLPALDSILGLN